MRTTRALLLLPLLSQEAGKPLVDFASLCRDLGDPRTLARSPSVGYTLRQVSSADAGRTDGVLLDVPGPGVVVRIFSPNPSGTLRVLLDDADRPLIEGPMEELLSDRSGFPPPFTESAAGSGTCFLPIVFSRRCRITREGTQGSSYEIAYRAYTAASGVTSSTSADRERAARIAPRVGAAWDAPAGKPTFTLSVSDENPNGGLVCVDPSLSTGPRAVVDLHLRVESADLSAALRSAVLHLDFDGRETVVCPLGEFFGVRGVASVNTWPMRVSRGIDESAGRAGEQVDLVCRWVMPYQERFDLRIDRGPKDLHVAGLVQTDAWDWDERSWYFHAASERFAAQESDAGTEATSFTLAGPGLFVGHSLATADDSEPGSAGRIRISRGSERAPSEGERASSEGEHTPSERERAPSEREHAPSDREYAMTSGIAASYGLPVGFLGACEGPFRARVANRSFLSLCRLRIPDAVPFQTSLHFQIEVPTIPVRPGDSAVRSDRSSTIFFYARAAASAGKPAPRK